MANGFVLVGLGGTGVNAVAKAKRKMEKLRFSDLPVRYFGIDTEDQRVDESHARLDSFLNIAVPDPAVFIKSREKSDEDLGKWWKKGYYPPGPIAGGANQIRQHGKLAFYYDWIQNNGRFAQTFRNLWQGLFALVARLEGVRTEQMSPAHIQTVVATSLGGGTGAGMVIDATAIIRNIIGPAAHLWGVCLDGHALQQIIGQRTGAAGFAAIMEIEHWMQNPQELCRAYPTYGLLEGNLIKFFDGVTLVEGENEDHRVFTGAYTNQTAKDDYEQLIAEFLTLMVSTDDFQRFTIKTDFIDLAKTESLQGRCMRYMSMAVTHLSFPYEEVVSFCTNRFVLDIINEGLKKVDLGTATEFERRQGILEREGAGRTERLLSQQLSKLPTANNLDDRLNKALRDIQRTNQGMFAKVVQRHTLNVANPWSKLFSDYTGEVQAFLSEQKVDFERAIVEEAKRVCANLRFQEIYEWLENLRGGLAEDKRSVEISTSQSERRDETLRDLHTKAGEVITYKRPVWNIIFGGGQYDSLRSRYIDLFRRWYLSEKSGAERNLLLDFYDDLLEKVNLVLDSVGYLAQRVEKERILARRELGKEGREWILDSDKAGLYTLDAQIAVPSEKLKKVYVEVTKDVKDTDFIGMGTAGKRGIKDLFDEIIGSLRKGDEGKRHLESIKERIEVELNELIHGELRRKIESTVERYNIGDALNWYLDGWWERIIKPKTVTEKRALANEAGAIFGSSISGHLASLRPQDPRSKEQWKKVASNSLFQKLSDMTKPFWVITPNITPRKDSYTFAPDAIKGLVGAREKSAHPGYATFYMHERKAPLFALQYLPDLKRRYDEASGTDKALFHTDVRFRDEWYDDVTQPAIREELYHPFIWGVGLEWITRRGAKALYLQLPEEGRIKLGDTLPRSLSKLGQNAELCKELRDRAVKTQQDIYTKGDRDTKLMSELVNDAIKTIKQWKPPKAQPEAYELWNSILKASKDLTKICQNRERLEELLQLEID